MSKSIKIKDLVPDDANFNTGTEFGNSLIDKSLSKFGAGRSILIDKNNRIIAGNKTIENAAANGFNDVVIVETTGDQIVAVKRTDIDLNTKKGREMALADNATAKANISWDAEALTDWDMPVAEWGIDLTEFAVEEVGDADAEPQIDKAAELNKKWKVKSGDLWQIGEHRLLCGDSTKREDVERLMQGDRASAVVTDSPYGIEREGIENDTEEGLRELFDGVLDAMPIEDAVVINFQSPRLFPHWIDAVRASGHKFERALWFYDKTDVTFPWRGWLMTSQIALVSSVGDATWAEGVYHHDCYIVESAGKQDDSGGHTTAKPRDIVQELIQHTVGLLYEPFAGSGTTLVACQNLNRKCYAIEISENYCAVILERMATAFPDLEIKRIDG